MRRSSRKSNLTYTKTPTKFLLYPYANSTVILVCVHRKTV
jgi:hypothetical protein